MNPWFKAVLTALALWIITLFFPFPASHAVVYGITSNLLLSLLILIGVIGIICMLLGYLDTGTDTMVGHIGSGFLVIALVCTYFIFDAYGKAVAYSFNPEETSIEALGDTTIARYNPFDIAKQKAKNSQTDSTRAAGDIDPLVLNGEIDWFGPVLPNGFGNKFSATTTGIIQVNEKNDAIPVNAFFACAENGFFSSNVYWRLYGERYFARYPEIYYVQYENAWYMVAPMLVREWHFPVMIEQWGGVVVLDSYCNTEELTITQAQNDPRTHGTNIFPADLVRQKTEAWGYRFGGLWNVLWYHRQEPEIHDPDYSENTQPYYLNTALGNMWIVSAEPHGDSFSVLKTFLFDTTTGKAYSISFGNTSSIVGPGAGISNAQSSTPGFTWVSKSGDQVTGNYIMLEPRPVTKNATWYWMYSATFYNTDQSSERGKYGDTSLVALLNAAHTDEVLHFCTHESFKSWLAGSGRSDALPCPENGSQPTEIPMGTVLLPQNLQDLSTEELWILVDQALEIIRSREK